MSILCVKPRLDVTCTTRLTFVGTLGALERMPTLSSPLAFEFCEGGKCADVKPSDDNKLVSCPPTDTCGKGGCYCQMFKRATGSGDDVAWDVAHEDYKGKIKHRPDKLDYKCFCVKPILEHEVTIDDVKYALRYQLCTKGTCNLVVRPIDPKHDEVMCTGTCEGECKCTMFRLKFADKAGFDPKTAKWERVAKTDKKVKPEDGYVYRCFCVQ